MSFVVPRITFASVLLLAVACAGGGNGNDGRCGAELLAGDLVISEVYADPPGEDTGKEWFEIYNASRLSADLTGLELIASRPDGTGEKVHVMGEATIASGGYLVLGGVLPELKPDYVGYGYGADLGALRNADGRLELRCNDVVVDVFDYGTLKESASKSYDGSLVPDSAGNDDLARWCDATSAFDTGQFGSPGVGNAVCTTQGNLDTCMDGTMLRNVEKPGPGDLVITELMPNPSGVDTDSDGEWFEIFVGRSVDLNGLEVGNVAGTVRFVLNDPNCRRVTSGSHVVFARNLVMTENGGLPADTSFAYTTASQSNTGGSIFIGIGGELIDSVSWSSSFDGATWSLDPGKRDATMNDDPRAWCKGVGAYSPTNAGTPGAINAACPPVVDPGMCRESNGNVRAIRKAAPGDLVITEFMTTPETPQAGKEWFEVLAKKDLDLNDLQLGQIHPMVKDTLTQTDCLPVTAGKYIVFLVGADTGVSKLANIDFSLDGFTSIVDPSGGSDPTMGSVNRGLFLAYGAEIVDKITYLQTTKPRAKIARQLSSDMLDSVANDNDPLYIVTGPQNGPTWCEATTLYPFMMTPPDPETRNHFGTPGAANRMCP